MQVSLESVNCGSSFEKKKKVPRRVIHCSDGVLEEYSTDEENDEVDAVQLPPVDPVGCLFMFSSCTCAWSMLCFKIKKYMPLQVHT